MLEGILSFIGLLAVGFVIYLFFSEETYNCNVCNNFKGGKQQVEKHYEEKHGWKCKICQYTGSEYGVKNHIKSIHLLYECKLETCDYKTYYESEFRLHLLEEKIDFLIVMEMLNHYDQIRNNQENLIEQQ